MLYTIYSNAFEVLEAYFCAQIKAQKSHHPAELFKPIRVISGSAAINQRLRLSLARNSGICAGVDFWTTQSWLHNYSGIGLGSAATNQDFVWIIWAALDSEFISAHPRLSHYFENKSGLEFARARYELSCKIAAVFDKYVNYRFDWVADWLNLKTNQTAETIWDKAQITHEAERLATNPDYSWQKALWKRLSQKEFRERFAWKGYETLKLYASEASREQKIENEPAILHFFAPFGISPLMLGVIKDLAEHEGEKGPKDVYAYILNPCRDYWFDSYGKDSDSDGKIIDYLRKNSAASRAMINRFYAFAEEGETAEPKNVRTVHSLATLGEQKNLTTSAFIDRMDLVRDVNLLTRAQKAILENDIETLPAGIDPGEDRSIRLIKAPNLTREVQNAVQLLHHLFTDKSLALSPDDVLIVTPDIEKTAPVIQSVVLALPSQYRIDFQIKGQSAATDDMTAKALIELGKMFMTAPNLKTLENWLELPLVAQCFDLSLEELAVIHDWLLVAGFRRGLTAEQVRQSQEFSANGCIDQTTIVAHEEGTLERALERLAWGFAMPEDRASVAGDVLAIQGDLGSRFNTVVKREALFEKLLNLFGLLKDTLTQTPGPNRVLAPALASAWAHDLVDRFFKKAGDVRALMAFESALRELDMSLAPQSDTLDDSISMPLAIYWRALEDHFRVPSDNQPTVGRVTLAPMGYARTLPYKVVIALGLNEESPFPGKQHFEEFDLMGATGLKRQNDRDSRADNRNVFLDLITSCRERLFLSYSVGMDEKNPQNPSPVVTDFMEFLTSNASISEQESMREALTVTLPLTDTSPENFTVNDIRYWQSYDQALLAALNDAIAQGYWQTEPQSITGAMNEELFASNISIDELAEFAKNPDQWVRKKLALRDFDEDAVDEIPLTGFDDYLTQSINRRRWLKLIESGLDQNEVRRLIENDPMSGAAGLRVLLKEMDLSILFNAHDRYRSLTSMSTACAPLTLQKAFAGFRYFKTASVTNLASVHFGNSNASCVSLEDGTGKTFDLSGLHPYLIDFITSVSSGEVAFTRMMLANALLALDHADLTDKGLGLIAIDTLGRAKTPEVTIYEPADSQTSVTFAQTLLKMVDIAINKTGLQPSSERFDKLIWRGREPVTELTAYNAFKYAREMTMKALTLNSAEGKKTNMAEVNAAWSHVNTLLDEEKNA